MQWVGNHINDGLRSRLTCSGVSAVREEAPNDHPDHLGSSSFITDAIGYATQHLQYLPFGETFVDQKAGSFDSRYKFSAKEKDDETQYSYFGARYYDSDLSVWLSVDPLADKYPSMSAYMYCAGNPVVLVDPDGRKVVLTGTDEENQAYVAELNSSLSTIQVELCGRNNNKLRIVGGNKQQLSENSSLLDRNVQGAINKGKNIFTPLIDDASIDFVQENTGKIDVGDLSRLSNNDKPLKEALFLRAYAEINTNERIAAELERGVIQHGYNTKETLDDGYGRISDKPFVPLRSKVGLDEKSNGIGVFNFGRVKIEISFDKNGIVTGSQSYQIGTLHEGVDSEYRIKVKSF